MNKQAFTLIELLVVIAIIAILAAILFPVFASAKNAAKATSEFGQAQQIGYAVKMYLEDNDDGMPIFYAYNSHPPAGQAGHKGVEVELAPYCKSTAVFRSPFDVGGPYTSQDVPGATSYWQAYGSSYRFTQCMYTIAANESSQNNQLYTFSRPVNDSQIEYPAESRAMRVEMFPFFAGQCAKYGYDCPSPYNYYTQWGPIGGSVIFVDGHAKYLVSGGQFDRTRVDPAGDFSGDPYPDVSIGTWYYACD